MILPVTLVTSKLYWKIVFIIWAQLNDYIGVEMVP